MCVFPVRGKTDITILLDLLFYKIEKRVEGSSLSLWHRNLNSLIKAWVRDERVGGGDREGEGCFLFVVDRRDKRA